MHKIFLTTIFMGLGLCYALTLSAQVNILYEQNFSGPGFPDGWTTIDQSPSQNVIWTWCADPTTGQMNGCPGIWNTENNEQVPFAATTTENGFLTLDSDFLTSGVGQPHRSQLNTPTFDFSEEDTVWVKFETHLGAFNFTPNGNALLRILKNGNFEDDLFNCFPEFPTSPVNGSKINRWSDNPKTIYFDVSEAVANQSSISFQWQWTGRSEYHWSIDDFQISSNDPRPAVDLIINRNNFLIPENAIIPLFEISPMLLGAKITNQGSQAQQDTKLAITILNDNNESIFTDTLRQETLAVDQESDWLVLNTFTPPNTPGIYRGIYTILPTDPDATPENNRRSFTFEISENILAKERQAIPDQNTAPLDEEWVNLEPHSWAWGNYFYIKNGQDQVASSAIFGIRNAIQLGGRTIDLTLFEWTDLDNDKLAQPNERAQIAVGAYTVLGTEPNTELISVPLVPFPSNALKNNQGYLLMIEYTAENVNSPDLFIYFSSEQDYKPTLDYLEASQTTRFASMLGIGHPINEETYSNLAFGFDKIPMVRLEIDESVGIENLLPEIFKVEISPNPTSKDIGVDFDFPEMIPSVTLNLYTQFGKLLITENLAAVQNERKIIAGSKLPSGIYYLEIKTALGRRTMPVLKVN